MAELKEGERIRLDSNNPRYRGRVGTFLKYDRNGFAVVKWDGNKAPSVFHKSAITRNDGESSAELVR